eukprot:COSAG06_NODE_21965_length_739_cov_0.834375_1_plen_205_part_00
MKCDDWWSTFDGSDTCGIDSFLHGSPNTRMIRADSSVDAPASFEVSISAPWLSAPRIPCPPRRLVPALFPAADAGCAISWTAHVDGRSAAYSYSVSIRHQRSLPVAVFSALRFSWIPAAQALCADIDNSSSEVWCFTRASEALRQLVRNDAALASVPSCRSTLFCRQSISPSTYCRAAVRGTRRRVSSACFLRSGSLSMAFVKI